MNKTTEVCADYCEEGQCQCKAGYYGLFTDPTECVPRNQCPNICPDKKNEVMYSCYDQCAPLVCPNVTQFAGPNCTSTCQSGVCDCIFGYSRNECGICVLAADCMKECTCPENESVQCVNPCSRSTCKKYVLNIKPKCLDDCMKACDCKPKYARVNSTQKCVKKTDCCSYPNY